MQVGKRWVGPLATPRFLPGPQAQSRWLVCQSHRQHTSDSKPLITPTKVKEGPGSSRRQVLLAGAAPVWCCACGCRNPAMDRLFAQSMAEGMGDYEAAIAPLKASLFRQLCEELQSRAEPGRLAQVVEVGIGTGPNLKYYSRSGGPAISITGVDPNQFMLPYLQQNAQEAGWPEDQLNWVEGTAEKLPLADASADAVVCTLVLCSVADVPAVLAEARRVLRPGGSFLFIEHTIAPEGQPLLRLGQTVLNPLQRWLADGCNLIRDPLPAIEAAGFSEVDAKRFSVEGATLIAPHVAGIATV